MQGRSVIEIGSCLVELLTTKDCTYLVAVQPFSLMFVQGSVLIFILSPAVAIDRSPLISVDEATNTDTTAYFRQNVRDTKKMRCAIYPPVFSFVFDLCFCTNQTEKHCLFMWEERNLFSWTHSDYPFLLFI